MIHSPVRQDPGGGPVEPIPVGDQMDTAFKQRARHAFRADDQLVSLPDQMPAGNEILAGAMDDAGREPELLRQQPRRGERSSGAQLFALDPVPDRLDGIGVLDFHGG